jgi:esterase
MHTTGFATSRTADGKPVRIFYRLFEPANQATAHATAAARVGTPVLIVHGLSFFSYDWIAPATDLATDRQVAALDMRGFGDSDWPGEYTLAAHASDIVAVLDHLGWNEAILIGHSMGGRHAAVAAAQYPHRFLALVLVDFTPENAPEGSARVAQRTASTPDSFASVEDAMRWAGLDLAAPGNEARRRRWEAYLKPVPASDGAAVRGAAGGLESTLMIKRDPHFREQFRRQVETGEKHKLELDLWKVLGDIRCPTLVIRGARSDMFAAEARPKVLASNERFRLVEVDAGHNVAGDDRAGFVGEVRTFIDTLGTQAQRGETRK